MPKIPTLTDSRVITKTNVFRIEARDLTFSNGEQRQYERLSGGRGGAASVMVVPVLDANTVILIREYGAGIHDYYLGFPKGMAEDGEDICAAANRELREETGYAAAKLSHIMTLSSSPGYTAGRMAIVLAETLTTDPLPGDEPEPIEVVPWSLAHFAELLHHPEFHEARSLAALYYVRDYLTQRDAPA